MTQPPYGQGGTDPNQGGHDPNRGYGQPGGYDPNQGYGQPSGYDPNQGYGQPSGIRSNPAILSSPAIPPRAGTGNNRRTAQPVAMGSRRRRATRM